MGEEHGPRESGQMSENEERKADGSLTQKTEPAPQENAADDAYRMAKEREVARIAQKIEEKRSLERGAKKKWWWVKTAALFAFIAVSIVILFTITNYITEDGIKNFGSMIWEINFGYFVLLVAVVLVYMLFESAKYSFLLKISTGKWHFKSSVKTMFLGKYYDGITPLATGGQPFQIYYLHKKDVPAGVATAVPLVKFIVNTFALGAIAVVFLCLSRIYLPGNIADKTILIWAWISMVANMMIPVAIVIVSLFPNFGKKAVAWIICLLSKMHIVKRKYHALHKAVYEIEEYRRSIKAIVHRWWLLIPFFFLCVAGLLVGHAIPFFVVVAIADVPPTGGLLVQIVCLSIISYYASALIPTPGASGASELASAFIFSTVFVGTQFDPIVGWVILVWRFFTYYIYILSGTGINIFEIIRDAVRNRRARRAEERKNRIS